MKQFIQWHNDTFGEKVVKALEKNNFQAHYAVNRTVAIEKALSLIPAGATIGVGGSWTLKELGIPEQLAKNGHTVYDHNIPGLTMEESLALRRKELLSDVFLSGANAITLDGQLVNTDGSGNRVAAMSFGPKKVIVIVGVNKIVSDLDAAMERIETVAAPINNKRLDRVCKIVCASVLSHRESSKMGKRGRGSKWQIKIVSDSSVRNSFGA